MIGAPPWSPFSKPLSVAAGPSGPGPTGKSYYFDGVDDYALANGTASIIDFGNAAHSVSVWA